jgi:hypothetical protein
MTHTEFEKAKKRLEQAKQDIFWAINVLNNSGSKLDEYQLTPQETEQLHSYFQHDLDEIQQALTLKPSTTREISRGIPPTAPTPRSPYREISGVPKIVGAIPPYDDDDDE